MKLFNLKLKYSPSFSKISQILHLQSRHIIVLLLRMNFSRNEYTSKTFVYNFKSMKLCIFWTIINWITIIFFTAIFFQCLPKYGKIYSAVLGVEKNYHRFSMMGTSTFIIAEFTWITAFLEHYGGKNKALDLVYELSSSLETELNTGQQEKRIRWFNRAHFLIDMHNKQVYAGITFQVFIVYGLFFKSYFNGEISMLEVPFYMFLCTSSNQLGAFSIVLFTNLINDFFFMIGVFKCKLEQCFHLLKCLLSSSVNNNNSSSNYELNRFDYQYSQLNRQINMYNVFVRKFILMCDMIIKFAANVTFITLLSQGNLNSNFVGLIILSFYVLGYISLQSLFHMLANFPKQNSFVYKTICSLSAHQILNVKNTFSNDRSSYPSRSCIKYLLKLNTLTEFLQQNQFGFTYSVFYLVQKWDILNNAFHTISLLLLFYKRYI